MKKIWDAISDFFLYHPGLEALAVVLGILLVALALTIAIILPLHHADVNEYNNGICNCGGHYEYSQAVGHAYSTAYIYVCDNCGTLIEIDYIP